MPLCKTPTQKLYALRVRGKIHKRILPYFAAISYYDLPYLAETIGVMFRQYRYRRHKPGAPIQTGCFYNNLVPPIQPRTPEQQAWWRVYAGAIKTWQNMSNAEKQFYKDRAPKKWTTRANVIIPRGLPGFHYFMHLYLTNAR